MARGYFKHLDVELLREYAKKWVKRFDYVMFEQIELRMFSHPHHLDDIARDQPEVVYAIIFKTLEPF